MKLSIIVPVYNAEDSILKLINTILSSKEIFELICVDDGSTDRSLEILKSIKDKRICVFTVRAVHSQSIHLVCID